MSKLYKNRQWLYQEYVIDEKPATELAKEAGCHFSTIYYWLEKHGIDVRDQSQARVVVFKDPRKRAARSKNQSELWSDEEYRSNQMKVRRSQEFRERQSEIVARIWQDPEYYQRQCESSRRLWQDPDYRQKTLRGLLKRWQDPEYVQAHQERLQKLWADPDYRCMMSEKASQLMRELWQDPDFQLQKAEEMSRRVRELWEDPDYQELQSEKSSNLMNERWQDPEWQSKMSQVASELWERPEYREKMSALTTDRWQDPEWRSYFSAFMEEKWQEEDYRNAVLDHLQDPDRRHEHGLMMSELWQDPEFVERVTMDRVDKIRNRYRTDIEAITEEAISQFELDYEFEYRVGKYSVDFYLPDYRIALECDGEYWHRNRQEKDAERDRYLQARGLTVIHLFGPDIRADVGGLLRAKLFPHIDISEDQ